MELSATRRSLHGVAELVVAGPQHRERGTIRLRPSPGGFAGVAIGVSVDGAALVWEGGRVPLAGTCRQLAAAAGLEAARPEGLYEDGSGVGLDEELTVDPEAAARLADWWATGDVALRAIAPSVVPVLWPEHFDLAVSVDQVTYGVSPGDGAEPRPYAYAAPPAPRQGPFWNAPFGASRPADELVDAAALIAFFAEARRRVAAGPSD